jgi:hypothetical protein
MSEFCIRCRREAPPWDSGEYVSWEAADETGTTIMCPGCLTAREQQSMDDDEEDRR